MRSTCQIAGLFFILIPGVFYLATISPTIDYRDSPEFVDTAFTLGISHPAGFPTYNLLAKGWTFLPLGSVAFKISLFSSVFACLALACLYGAALRLLGMFYPEAGGNRMILSAALPVGFLAFCLPFWLQATVAEVYTLHAFFVALIIFLLLLWMDQKDVRLLYAAALVFGLSSGNHATSAFILPSILVLFFCLNRENSLRHLSVSILFFLVGLSVYLYLPVRSLAEPSIDWGNPETLKSFLYQVTDRKDAETHFSYFRKNLLPGGVSEDIAFGTALKGLFGRVWVTLWNLLQDLGKHLSLVSALGFLAGGVLCYRKSLPVFWFFLLLAGFNVAFFAGWREESYFPTYIVASLLTSVFIYEVLCNRVSQKVSETDTRADPDKTGVNWRRIIFVGLILLVPWAAVKNFYQADRSRYYFGETLLKRAYLSLEDHSVFVPGISWFNFYYHNDVMRLRDDVTAIKAWDFLGEDPASLLTRKRYPDLVLPEPSRHSFNSREEASRYVDEFFALNGKSRPVLVEQNLIFLDQLALADRLEPNRNLFLKYAVSPSNAVSSSGPDPAFAEFKVFLTDELKKPGIQSDPEWANKPSFYIPSFADYYHSKGMYSDERDVLGVMRDFLGHGGPDWRFKMADNLILDGKITEARKFLEEGRALFGEHYLTPLAEGLLLRAAGDVRGSIEAIRRSADMNRTAFRPRLELAVSYRLQGNTSRAFAEKEEAEKRVVNLRQLKRLRRLFND